MFPGVSRCVQTEWCINRSLIPISPAGNLLQHGSGSQTPHVARLDPRLCFRTSLTGSLISPQTTRINAAKGCFPTSSRLTTVHWINNRGSSLAHAGHVTSFLPGFLYFLTSFCCFSRNVNESSCFFAFRKVKVKSGFLLFSASDTTS